MACGHQWFIVQKGVVQAEKINSFAFRSPTARARFCVPPMPGIIPIFVSVWAKVAVSLAKAKSKADTSSHPPPKAAPFIAPITGI